MFWECHVVTSSIDKLFEQPIDQLKLQDFLDESDLIQECLNQNQRLIDYLVEKSVMIQLIEHIINLPKDENFRNANITCELLSGDFPRIQECLLAKDNFDLLYSFLKSSNQTILNPILASYFARIINTLIIRRPTDLIKYFRICETFKDDFLNNLESTSICDIIFHLISDSGEQRSDVIKWFEEINLIDGLVDRFIETKSMPMQNNIANLFNEIFRLAFDQQIGSDCDFAGPTLSATIERLLNSRNENFEGSLLKNSSLIHNDDKKSMNVEIEGQTTALVLAEHILSKSNLEKLIDTIVTRPLFVNNGCDFLSNIFDLLNRHLPTPVCVSLISKDDSSIDNERMQINDEGDVPSTTKSNENINNSLANNANEPLMKIYLSIIDIIPTRLPALINLLSVTCPPLVQSTNENSPAVKYQFISEPLGSARLNLIKVFSKMIQTISNDFTGDKIYEIFTINRLFSILLDLFLRHIYNNFLHTQIYSIVRSILYINSLAVKQATDIWTRLSIPNVHVEQLPNSSPFHHTNRASYKFFQSILNSSDINLFERLIDPYELNVTAAKALTTSSLSDETTLLHTRFTSPNSGHIAQILRCLRDHASIFNNYSAFFKSNKDEQIDEDTNVVEIRWQSTLDYLTEDEKKWAAMHYTERTTNNFRISSNANYLIHSTNESSDIANQRRQNFHMRSFGNSGTPYVDEDEDDDEIERFDIDDETMKNEQNTNERKVADMKKISFEPQMPANFTEQSLWHQQDETIKDNDKLTLAPTLPDLFENHRNQYDKLNLSTESNFEQLCSIRANDNGSGLFPFQSSSTIRDEVGEGQDEF